jgi:hypothetical protein
MAKIYDVLHRDHAELHALLEELHNTVEPEAKRRTAVLAVVVEHLTAHSRAAQEVVYPALGKDVDGAVMLRQALADHSEIETALRELVACDVHDELWTAKLEVLRAAVETHVAREEGDLFEALHEAIDDTRAEELAEDFGRRKAVLTGHAA